MRNTAPWFREVSTFTSWPQSPRAHAPFGRDKITPAQRKSLQGIPLFINVQTEAAIREAHRLGGRALSYLSFMDTFVHTAGFENGTARVPWDPRKPQALLIDRNGCFVNTLMDGTRRMWRYSLCNNTRECVELVLEMVREQMRRGADGIFVDNSDKRAPCYGHGFPVGYTKKYRMVVTGIPTWKNPKLIQQKTPEKLYRLGIRPAFPTGDKVIGAIPKHRHIYPDKSHDFAYVQLLKKARQVVRSYGPDKVIVVNGGLYPPSFDGVMLESFMYSWAWKGALMSWEQAKAQSAASRPYMDQGGRMIALSYFGNTDRSPDEDALHSFAAAMLLGYLWSDYGTLHSALGRTLRTLSLGRPLTGLAAAGPVEYRFFQRGLIAINDTPWQRTATIPAPPRSGLSRLMSLADGTRIVRANGSWRLALPAHSGGVFVDR